MSSFKSEFHKWLLRQVAAADYDRLTTLFGHGHRYNTVMAYPNKATHSELLALSDFLGMSPLRLLFKWDFGMDIVTDVEFLHLQRAASAGIYQSHNTDAIYHTTEETRRDSEPAEAAAQPAAGS